jgi:hypothetical protein
MPLLLRAIQPWFLAALMAPSVRARLSPSHTSRSASVSGCPSTTESTITTRRANSQASVSEPMISILAQHMDLVGVARFNELAFIVAQAVESPQTTSAGPRGNRLTLSQSLRKGITASEGVCEDRSSALFGLPSGYTMNRHAWRRCDNLRESQSCPRVRQHWNSTWLLGHVTLETDASVLLTVLENRASALSESAGTGQVSPRPNNS